MNHRAQVSIEFFIFVGLAFSIAIAFALASLDHLNGFRLDNENAVVKDLALKLQKEVLIAAYVEDGYLRKFELPDKLDKINYSVTINNSTITIESKNSVYTVFIPSSIGNFSKGTNMIRRSENVIYIN